MQVTLEQTSTLERKMRISVPSDEVETKVDAKIKETAGQVRLKGFRPGKVPLREVRRRFGDGIRQEVSSELMQTAYTEALQQEDVAPAGMPRIEDVTMESGKDFEFTAVFEVFPEIELGDFGAISVEKPVAEITDADLEGMIEKLREQRTTFEEVDRAAAMDDQVVIDFEGFIDDEPFDGGKAEGVDLVLGSNSMIPGFEDGLVGASKDDDTELNVSFPEDYHADNLAGKAAVFKVKVQAVKASVKPELNDEFYKEFGVEEGGEEAFHAEVRSNMDKELTAAVKNKVKNQVMDGLAEVTEVEIPQALVDQEIDRMRQDAAQRFGGGQQFDASMLPAELFQNQATPRVKLGLIVNAIVEQLEIEADDAKVRETIEEMASSYEEPEQVVNFYYNNPQQLSQIQNMVLEEQVVDTVLEKAQVTEVTMSYDDAVKPPEPAPVEQAEGDADEPEAASEEAPKED